MSQTFTDFELIVSDNFSTDSTEIICRRYAENDSRIRYIRQSVNVGPVANFQNVLDLAIGDYFMWAAADDIWDAGWIKRLLPIAEKYQCISTGVYKPIDSNENEIQHPANNRKLEYCGPKTYRRIKFYLEPGVLGKGNPIYGIMPTKILKKIGVSWVASEPLGGVTVYLYVLLSQMEIRSEPSVILYKRLHSESYGEMIATIKVHNSTWRKKMIIAKNILIQPIPSQYSRKSTDFQKPLIWLLYPVAIFWGIYSEIAWKVKRFKIHGRP